MRVPLPVRHTLHCTRRALQGGACSGAPPQPDVLLMMPYHEGMTLTPDNTGMRMRPLCPSSLRDSH
jgi:hypothetical protein